MSERNCRKDPCASCPYRKDTPPGVWAAEEYNKLPRWDDPLAMAGVFLCHHSTTTGQDTICRGWMEVHRQNLSVRVALFSADLSDSPETMLQPTKVELYNSGAEACEAGMRGVDEPSEEAIAVIDKLTMARRLRRKRK